jgi:hypothetical protein
MDWRSLEWLEPASLLGKNEMTGGYCFDRIGYGQADHARLNRKPQGSEFQIPQAMNMAAGAEARTSHAPLNARLEAVLFHGGSKLYSVGKEQSCMA